MSSSVTSVPTLSPGVVPELGFAVGASCAVKSAVALVLLCHGRNGGLVACPLGWVRRGTQSWGALHVQSRIDPWLSPWGHLNSGPLQVQFQLGADAGCPLCQLCFEE